MTNYKSYGYQYDTNARKLQSDYMAEDYYYRTKKSKTKANNKNNNIKSRNVNKKKSEVKKVKANKDIKNDLNKKTVKVGSNVKKKAKYNYQPIIYIALIFSMLFVISYRYSLINEKYTAKENIRTKVGEVQKKNEQLKVNIQNNLNLSSIEKAAVNRLGMQKLDNDQKVYLNLKKKDYVEPASEKIILNDEESWFDKIMKKLTQIIK